MDLLIYVLIFLGILLLNYVMQRAARRRQQEEQAQVEAPAEPPPAADEPLEDIWGRTSARAPAPAPVLAPHPAPPVLAQAPAPRLMHPARVLLMDKRDLRRAVVLMMVLGPCRAQEPPER
jgi:hypothetical protein